MSSRAETIQHRASRENGLRSSEIKQQNLARLRIKPSQGQLLFAHGSGLARVQFDPVHSDPSPNHVHPRGAFRAQTVQKFDAALELNYTIFDFGARAGRTAAAGAELLTANFALKAIR